MSLVFQSIAVFVCFLSTNCFQRSQFSVGYSHAINDCFHLCFGIESCVEDCQFGYSARKEHLRGQRKQFRQRGRGRLRRPSQDKSPIGFYSSKALSDAIGSPKTKKVSSYSFTKLSQPKHCGLRYTEKKLKGVGSLGMGRIVGGIAYHQLSL